MSPPLRWLVIILTSMAPCLSSASADDLRGVQTDAHSEWESVVRAWSSSHDLLAEGSAGALQCTVVGRDAMTSPTRAEFFEFVEIVLIPLIELSAAPSELMDASTLLEAPSESVTANWSRLKILQNVEGERNDVTSLTADSGLAYSLVRTNGVEAFYRERSGQVNVARKPSHVKLVRLEDLAFLPRAGATGLSPPSQPGEFRWGPFDVAFDPATGFVSTAIANCGATCVREEIRQYSPMQVSEGIWLPELSVEAHYHADDEGLDPRVFLATIRVVETLEVSAPPMRHEFELAVPAGTRIVKDLDDAAPSAFEFAQDPVPDVVTMTDNPAFGDSAYGLAAPRERQTQLPAANEEVRRLSGWWLLGISLGLVLAVVGIVFWRRSRTT